jgi:hypothetical protein
MSHKPMKVKIRFGDADADRLQKRCLFPQACHLKDARGEIQDRIDA